MHRCNALSWKRVGERGREERNYQFTRQIVCGRITYEGGALSFKGGAECETKQKETEWAREIFDIVAVASAKKSV